MAPKRRAPSPPPPPQEESSSEESSSGEEEEEEEMQAVPTPQRPPQNPKPPSTAAANDDDDDDDDDESSEGSDEEESSDSKIDAEAFQLRPVERFPSKPSAAAPQLESGDNPEHIQKKETKNLKSDAGKKRLASEPISSGKDKKAKAKVEKASLEPILSDHDKKAKSKSGAEKMIPELTPSRKAKKLKAEPEKAALDFSSSSKSEKKKWTSKDEIMILKAAAGHVKSTGKLPSASELVAAVGDSLDRKKCSNSEMYDKVRTLKQRYEKAASAGALPSEGDELQKYKLSESVWGENAKEVAVASISQKDGTPSKSKKGQSKREKMDVHSKGGTSKEATTAEETIDTHADSKKGQGTKRKIDGDTKSRSSKKSNTTVVPDKNKNHGYHKEEAVEDAKTSTAKETTTAATKEKMDVGAEGHGPKDATVSTQNGGTLTQSENRETQNGMEIDANVQGVRRGLNELRNLYPNLTSYMESMKAQHPCGETLMRAFHFIDDQKASALESKIKKQRIDDMKMEIRQCNMKKELANILLEFLH